MKSVESLHSSFSAQKWKLRHKLTSGNLSSACGSLYLTGEAGMTGERKEGRRGGGKTERKREKESVEGCGEVEGGREGAAHWEGLT